MYRVFLGGTCNGSTWRDKLKPQLTIEYFDPVVEDWTPDSRVNEEYEKENKCDIHLYYIDSHLSGVYSIAEMIQSSNNKSKITIIQINPKGFTESMKKSLKACCELANKNGALVLWSDDLSKLVTLLNTI